MLPEDEGKEVIKQSRVSQTDYFTKRNRKEEYYARI
jgi:hypothetical protein